MTLGVRQATPLSPKSFMKPAMISLASGGCSEFGSKPLSGWAGRFLKFSSGRPRITRASCTYQHSSPMSCPGQSPSRKMRKPTETMRRPVMPP
jgi:hypothetical protein